MYNFSNLLLSLFPKASLKENSIFPSIYVDRCCYVKDFSSRNQGVTVNIQFLRVIQGASEIFEPALSKQAAPTRVPVDLGDQLIKFAHLHRADQYLGHIDLEKPFYTPKNFSRLAQNARPPYRGTENTMVFDYFSFFSLTLSLYTGGWVGVYMDVRLFLLCALPFFRLLTSL